MDLKNEAIKLFNETWDLIDKIDRTEEDNIMMLHKAHTSFYLWTLVGDLVNHARGEWQVSRVYSVLGEGKLALLHGKRSLDICLKNNYGGLDLAFGYESVVRAYGILGLKEDANQHKQLGIKACEGIENWNDREYALSEINSIKI